MLEPEYLNTLFVELLYSQLRFYIKMHKAVNGLEVYRVRLL